MIHNSSCCSVDDGMHPLYLPLHLCRVIPPLVLSLPQEGHVARPAEVCMSVWCKLRPCWDPNERQHKLQRKDWTAGFNAGCVNEELQCAASRSLAIAKIPDK